MHFKEILGAAYFSVLVGMLTVRANRDRVNSTEYSTDPCSASSCFTAEDFNAADTNKIRVELSACDVSKSSDGERSTMWDRASAWI